MTYILTSVVTASNAAVLGVKADSDPHVTVVAEGKQQTHTSSFMSPCVTDTLISVATTSCTDGLIAYSNGELKSAQDESRKALLQNIFGDDHSEDIAGLQVSSAIAEVSNDAMVGDSFACK